MPTSANIVVVPCKRTQQATTLLGPTMLGVVGQQCCVRLHGLKGEIFSGQFSLEKDIYIFCLRSLRKGTVLKKKNWIIKVFLDLLQDFSRRSKVRGFQNRR